jgi:hypothetical protein
MRSVGMTGVWKSTEPAPGRSAPACEARPVRRAGDKPAPAILVHHPASISLERALWQGLVLDAKAQVGHVRLSPFTPARSNGLEVEGA